MSDEQTPDLMGYPSVEELAKAKRSTDQAFQTERQGRIDAEARLQQFLAANQPGSQNRSVEQRLGDVGIPVEDLDTYVGNRISKAFEPIVQQLQGQAAGKSKMLATYGADYTKYEADVAQFVSSDPAIAQEYQSSFAANPAMAMEWAFLKYGEQQRKQAPAKVKGDRQQQTEASMPQSRGGGAPVENGAGQDIAAALEHFQKTGDPVAYAKSRLRHVIKDEFLNQ